MNKDYENLEEIIDLCKEELKNNNQDTTAVLDIIDLKSLNNILLDYKRLLNENEELKKYKRYYDCTKLVVDNNYIHKQKIKDKIEELKKDKDSKYYYMFLEKRDIENTIKVLKELLEREGIYEK